MLKMNEEAVVFQGHKPALACNRRVTNSREVYRGIDGALMTMAIPHRPIFSRCAHVVRDLKTKQKLGVTFDSDKLGDTYFTKFSKLTLCSA